jgi:hypothetical protein
MLIGITREAEKNRLPGILTGYCFDSGNDVRSGDRIIELLPGHMQHFRSIAIGASMRAATIEI